jgi:adenine-specific DNA-methyltransferase
MSQKQEPKQIELTSPDGREARLSALRSLFPDLFDGEGVLDEKALRQLVTEEAGHITERFRFEWAGKAQSKRFAFTPSKATLVYDPERSINADGSSNKVGEHISENTSKNLIIEGDNLEVLKLLQASYFEQVKCIYIDPPYNTGNDFIYPDDYSQTRKDYWESDGTTKEGVRLKAVTEASGRRHSEWLSFMSSRLLCARNLLSDDGVIFISIDDDEAHNLRKLADDIFGSDNFICQLVWHKKYTRSNDAKFFSDNHDYIIVYAKNKQDGLINLLPRTESANAAYSNPDEHAKGRWKATPLHAKSGKEGGFSYTFTNGVTWVPPSGTFARFSRDTLKRFEDNDEIYFGKDGTAIPSKKSFLTEVKDGITPVTILPYSEVGHTHESNQELKDLGLDGVFQNPKPTRLIERIIELSTKNDSEHIVMDFFAGSGTTGHSILKKNFADSGNRKYICVQIPETIDEGQPAYSSGFRKISDVTIERIKRAGKELQKTFPDTVQDIGFRVATLGSSHFPHNTFSSDPYKSEEANIAALEAHLQAAAQLRLFGENEFQDVVTEIALKNGFGLFYALERIENITSNATYRLTGNSKEVILCLDRHLEDATVEALKSYSNYQLIVLKAALDTTKKFELQTTFNDNLWVI